MRALNELRNLDIDVIDIDGEIAYLAFAKSVQAEYSNFNADPPEWLPLRVKQLERDIKSKRQAIIEKRIRDLENRKAALLPRDKKLENIDQDLALLRKQLEP